MRILHTGLTLSFCLIVASLNAQIGGRYVFESLRVPASARLAALGGANISLMDRDVLMAFGNPSLLNNKMHTGLGLSGVSYLAGIGYGTAAYVHHADNVGTFMAGIQYMGYGNFQQADELGNLAGTYSANDMMLNLAAARSFGRFSYGMGAKLLYSHIAGFNALGLAVDMGGTYYHEGMDLGVALVVRNFGTQLVRYVPTDDREPLPLDVQLGVSKRVPHTPMRFSLTLHNLNNPRLVYRDEDRKPKLDLNGNPIEDKPSTADQIFRHAIFGVEFLLSKHFHLRFAYNHQRRREFRLAEQGFSLDGFSGGFGMRVSKFHLDYGFARFFQGGTMHQFGICFYLNQFGQKGLPAAPPSAE